MTTARLRPAAEDDLVERSHHYRIAGGAAVATRFFDASLAALRAIERMPGIGSPVPGERLGIDGLRAHRVKGFPCCWYYFQRVDHVDVVRLLADVQDLSLSIGSPDG